MSYNEEIEEEINEEEIFGENEITNIDDDLVIEDEIVDDDGEEIQDYDEEEYDYVSADDIPTYSIRAVISIFLCFPLGILAVLSSKKTKEALRKDDLQSAVDSSDKTSLYFKVSLLFAIVMVVVIPFVLKSFFSNADETIVKAPQEVHKPVEAPRQIPQWEISAKKIIHLEKSFYVNNGSYRYYFSEEIANDEVLSFNYNSSVEKFHYMTQIDGDKISVIAYEAGVKPGEGEAFIMDMNYNIQPYEFSEEK